MDNITATNPKSSKISATYGLYIGILIILCTLLQSAVGANMVVGILIWLVKLVGSIYLLITAVKRYRNIELGGFISFSKAFSFSLMTSLIATLINVAYVVITTLINGEALSEQLYTAYEQLVDRGIMSMDMVHMIVDNIVWIMPLGTLIWGMVVGCIYSLIMGASLKRNPTFS